MNGRPDHQTILEVTDALHLPAPALVEKDWHVVHALAAIHDVDLGGLKLVFGGGTSLGRAHGLLQRMSEDIDLRIVSDKPLTAGDFKRIRRETSKRLEAAGFPVEDHALVLPKKQYVRYDLPYDAKTPGEGVLRPEIKIELSAFPLLRDPVICAVRSFVAEATQAPPEIAAIACVSIGETAADKLVALTRRAGAAFAGIEALDHTLVRHVYDLQRLDNQHELDDTIVIALEVLRREAAERAETYSAYAADPIGETLRSVEAMSAHAGFQEGYARLLDEMVYGDRPDFATAIAVVQNLAVRLRDS